jgi:hypothetical protein
MSPCISEVHLHPDHLDLVDHLEDADSVAVAGRTQAVLHISTDVGNAPCEVVREHKAAETVMSDRTTLARMR